MTFDTTELEPLAVSPRRAAFLLGCGLTRWYELLKAGDLESYRDGKSRKIVVASIKAYIDQKIQAGRHPRAA